MNHGYNYYRAYYCRPPKAGRAGGVTPCLSLEPPEAEGITRFSLQAGLAEGFDPVIYVTSILKR
jgi:hypothetical protein